MQNFDNIKDLWQKNAGSPQLPSTKEILLQVKAARKKMIRKNIFVITLLVLTFVFIGWVGFHYDFELITTRIGIIITLIAIVTGIIFNTKLANMLAKQNDPTLSSNAYLQQLIEYRNHQRIIQTKGISVYFILLTTGILLYMYEFAARNLTFGIIVYALTLAWIGLNWFYLRKKSIAKQEKQINEQIKALEDLSVNLETEKNETSNNNS